MSNNPVWKWMRMSEKEFRKISGKGKCVKCGKTTNPSKYSLGDNLCRGHKIAYRRWRNERERKKVNTMIDVCRSKRFLSRNRSS